MSPYDYAIHYTTRLGFALVPIMPGSKGPKGWGWQKQGVPAVFWRAHPEMGMGLIHALSNTVALDVDHPEWAALALRAVGIDLEALEASARYRIQGRKGAKPIYLLPDGESLTRRPLAWPHPTERLEGGRPRLVTLFELRSASTQDVLPPSLHPDTGRPYTWCPELPGDRGELEPLPAALLELWRNWGEARKLMLAACPWYEPALPEPRTKSRWQGDKEVGESVIAAFNRVYSVGEILERNSYRRRGERYIAPSSSTGLAGVVLLEGRAYSHHGSDVLNDGHTHDAFDVFRLLEHGGEWRAAVRAAAALLGLHQRQEQGAAWVEPVDALTPEVALEPVRRVRRTNTLKAREVHRWR